MELRERYQRMELGPHHRTYRRRRVRGRQQRTMRVLRLLMELMERYQRMELRPQQRTYHRSIWTAQRRSRTRSRRERWLHLRSPCTKQERPLLPRYHRRRRRRRRRFRRLRRRLQDQFRRHRQRRRLQQQEPVPVPGLFRRRRRCRRRRLLPRQHLRLALPRRRYNQRQRQIRPAPRSFSPAPTHRVRMARPAGRGEVERGVKRTVAGTGSGEVVMVVVMAAASGAPGGGTKATGTERVGSDHCGGSVEILRMRWEDVRRCRCSTRSGLWIGYSAGFSRAI